MYAWSTDTFFSDCGSELKWNQVKVKTFPIVPSASHLSDLFLEAVD